MIKLKLSAIITAIIIISTNALFSQLPAAGESNKAKPEKLEFLLVNKFPVNIVHQYILIDTTNVTRMYSDSTIFNYQQITNYNFNVKAPNRPDNDGNFSLDVSIDSIYFNFKSPKKQAEYNTAWDEGRPPFDIRNYEHSTVALGMEYNMQYSPYDEVTNISSERMTTRLKDITDPINGIKDSMRKYIWVDGMSMNNLEYISDVNKNILPDNKVTADTFWITTVKCKVDGVYFTDTVKFKIKSYTTKVYKLTGESIGRHLDNTPTLVYDINKFLKPMLISGTSVYNIDLTPKGTIENLSIVFDLNLLLQYNSEPIVHVIKSNQKWKLIDRYNY